MKKVQFHFLKITGTAVKHKPLTPLEYFEEFFLFQFILIFLLLILFKISFRASQANWESFRALHTSNPFARFARMNLIFSRTTSAH
jgi:hypothetical protein